MVLPGKRGHSELAPSKTGCPNPGGFGEEFHSIGSRRWGIADKDQGVCRTSIPLIGPHEI